MHKRQEWGGELHIVPTPLNDLNLFQFSGDLDL